MERNTMYINKLIKKFIMIEYSSIPNHCPVVTFRGSRSQFPKEFIYGVEPVITIETGLELHLGTR